MAPPKKKSDELEIDVDVDVNITTRTFTLRAPAEGTPEDEVVHHVAFGASPHISIGTGKTFITSDELLAARCAAHPHLEEVSS